MSKQEARRRGEGERREGETREEGLGSERRPLFML